MAKYPKKTEYYKFFKHHEVEGALIVRKFDKDLVMMNEYVLNKFEAKNGHYYDCNCPAAIFDCRHKKMLKVFEAENKLFEENVFYGQHDGKFHTFQLD